MRILQLYGVKPVRFLGMQKGYRNESHAFELADGERVNLILYKSEPDILPRIRRANAVADFLHDKGLPVRYTLDPRIITLKNGERVKYGALYAYLPGETIPWEAYTQTHIKALGEMMGRMHGLLAGYPATPQLQGHSVASEYARIAARMQRYFATPAVAQAIQEKLHLHIAGARLAKLQTVLAGCENLPHQQPLHMDFVRGNILFSREARITGVLDFEKTAFGHPLFDIARTVAFLLVDCKYKTEAQVRKYFLISGYNKRGGGTFKVTARALPLLEALVDLFLLHDFYKFLRHNPYEFLNQNEHFTRTVQQLQKRGLVLQK
ncbi:MAG TPA: phosphotransferase [Candidatus Saccharimonadales bacterium]|nr:phosphotransferase [Candidatus Saccharimonadales bacterium]